MAKTVVVTLPGALLVLLWRQRGRLTWRRDVVLLSPAVDMGGAAGLFTAWLERRYIGAQGAAFDLTILERFLLAGRVIWFYLEKLLWPVDLMFIYPRWEVNPSVAGQYVFPLGIVVLGVFLWL